MDDTKKKIIREYSDDSKLKHVLPDGKNMKYYSDITIPFYNADQVDGKVEVLDTHQKIVLTALVNATVNMSPVECGSLTFYSGEPTISDIDMEYMILTQHVDYDIERPILTTLQMKEALERLPSNLLYHPLPSDNILSEFKNTGSCKKYRYRLADNILLEYVMKALSKEPILCDLVGKELEVLH
jgi:hypothetical protein